MVSDIIIKVALFGQNDKLVTATVTVGVEEKPVEEKPSH